ncbi:DUF2157 domain-containing protein [Bizionia myxarmorum]|uniref:DUF2157 domain-containing protein n=1 Tax=Bizionia myxarmorum TaxID=291186 RepID=A0A5D0RBH1_9FLAO|nr:DUF2157 domain-containing protein [Bizionia myxarmorum]TYB78857.1 DUF2157 domain-containing protein [Bizionia myxarmorum]
MAKIERNDIHIISRHSNWSESEIKARLQRDVYHDKEAWQKFLNLLFISLGVGFTTAGILFFFAYNWADLHKFAKLGLIEGLIIAITAVILFSKWQLNVKNILLTGASMIVGVLFAVFGQIYQTGANAYDFFLGWTLFIFLWVVVSNFAPLWLIFIILINTTVILYIEQVAQNWPEIIPFTLLFGINTVFLFIALIGEKLSADINPPTWFTNILALAAASFGTIAICYGIFDDYQASFLILVIATALLYAYGIYYGIQTKSIFYLSIIPFSLIVIGSALLISWSDDGGMFFVISLFIILSVTFLIANLIKLQKRWVN